MKKTPGSSSRRAKKPVVPVSAPIAPSTPTKIKGEEEDDQDSGFDGAPKFEAKTPANSINLTDDDEEEEEEGVEFVKESKKKAKAKKATAQAVKMLQHPEYNKPPTAPPKQPNFTSAVVQQQAPAPSPATAATPAILSKNSRMDKKTNEHRTAPGMHMGLNLDQYLSQHVEMGNGGIQLTNNNNTPPPAFITSDLNDAIPGGGGGREIVPAIMPNATIHTASVDIFNTSSSGHGGGGGSVDGFFSDQMAMMDMINDPDQVKTEDEDASVGNTMQRFTDRDRSVTLAPEGFLGRGNGGGGGAGTQGSIFGNGHE